MIVLMVGIRIKEGHKEEFMKEMMGDAIGSNRDEPGCLRFDVLQDDQEPNTLHLYEVYRDQAALEVHRQAPHYIRWRDIVADWHAEPPVRRSCSNVFPVDDAWR